MELHEKHCTLNPNRECRMCEKIETLRQPPMADLVAIMPNPEQYKEIHAEHGYEMYPGLQVPFEAALAKLIDAAQDCPMCILAALKQSGTVQFNATWDFQKECKSIWADINDTQNY